MLREDKCQVSPYLNPPLLGMEYLKDSLFVNFVYSSL